MKTAKRSVILACLMFCAVAIPADEVKDTLGEHVVQPGETMESITAKYLGDRHIWRENWRLNPDVSNPNKLRIGQKLTVIKERRIDARSAEISTLSNEVQRNVQRSDWVDANRGDQLMPLDGVRTLSNSSASLQFNDNSSLKMTEYSQIFLERRETTLRNVDSGRIEVVKGSAELVFEPISRQKTDIELVTGQSVTRPEPTADGTGRLRARADQSGGAKVMVYSGFSAVSAGGQTVRVGSGLGTAIPDTGPPGKPEKLLGSARLESPADGARWPVSNEQLKWRAVDGADSYIVDICADRECANLVSRGSDIAEPFWQVEVDRAGTFYWQITAVSPSGLEGYPSRVRELTVLSTIKDSGGPMSAIIPVGFHRQMDDGALLIGDNTRLRLVARDDAVDVAAQEYRWGDGDWQSWAGEDLSLVGLELPVTLYVRATDGLGKTGDVVELPLSRQP